MSQDRDIVWSSVKAEAVARQMTGRTRAELRSAWNTNDGGKGVISQIKPDAEMPTTEDGRRADLVINSLGVVNRLNNSRIMQ